jgi:hypothetical protein
MQGGMNINSVPDRAEFCVDVSTIPGQISQPRERLGRKPREDPEIRTA